LAYILTCGNNTQIQLSVYFSMHGLNSFFIFCSGSDSGLLKKCPTETSKYVGIGATVFFTGLFAALAGGYALYTVFDNIWAALFFGTLWGLMIFNLDRFIVASMRKEGRTSRELLTASPRIILAILISIVIAKPLELKIFDKEIQPELIVMEQEKFAVQEAKVDSRFRFTQDSLKQELTSIRDAITAQTIKRNDLVRIAQEEADGTGGSRKKNPGPIYKIKKADADRADLELQQLIVASKSKTDQLESQIAENDLAIKKEIASWGRKKIDGPAARIEALDRLTAESNAMWWAHWFIVLLFIALETSPVFVKLISSRGPYDRLLKMEEHQFVVQEIETLAQAHAGVKERNTAIAQHERSFINDRLDASLKNS
jgi:hypothetical protein